MFIIDFDDTLFDTHALKEIIAKAPHVVDEKYLEGLLFPDAFIFLRYLKTKNEKLILLSFGEFEFQNKKIGAAGIAHLFDEIIITPDAKENAIEKILENHYSCTGVVQKDEAVWIINDKIEETKKILEHFPKLKPLLKKSPQFTDEEYCSALMPCFDTLTQIQQYVERQIK